VDPSQVRLLRGAGDDLIVAIEPAGGGGADRLTLRASFEPQNAVGGERIFFEDSGIEWVQADFAGIALVTAATNGDDDIVGSSLDDALRGRLGADTIEGREGGDTYEFARGDGRDV
jgi:Ca2+-binding RTX toxin-like protein